MEQTLKDIEYLITEGWLLPAFITPSGHENEILDTIKFVLEDRDNPPQQIDLFDGEESNE